MINSVLIRRIDSKLNSFVYLIILVIFLTLLVIWYFHVENLGKLYLSDACDLKANGQQASFVTEVVLDMSFSNCLGIEKINDKKCRGVKLLLVEDIYIWKPYKLPSSGSFTNQRPISNVKSVGWWSYPDEIIEITSDPNDLLILVNKKYKLPSIYVPSGLINLGDSGVRNSGHHLGRLVMLDDLTLLASAAKLDGVDLAIRSAYRSYNTQVSTYDSWLNKYGNNVDLVDTFSAKAGHSQHQLGTVIDFTTNECNDCIGNAFNTTKACKWLEENAWKYGFVISYPSGAEQITGYKYEGWHYRYIGIESANNWKVSGLVLDEFLKLQDINLSFIAIP